jgi:hypothetical protein
MESQQQERTVIKLFAGYRVTPPLKFALEHSSIWKNSQIDPGGELTLVTRQGIEYLGVYANTPAISLDKLHIIDEQVREKIEEYSPGFNLSKLKLQLFSQLFIR